MKFFLDTMKKVIYNKNKKRILVFKNKQKGKSKENLNQKKN